MNFRFEAEPPIPPTQQPVFPVAEIKRTKADADQQVMAWRKTKAKRQRPSEAEAHLQSWHAYANMVLNLPHAPEDLANQSPAVRTELLAAAVDQLNDHLGLIGSDFANPDALQERVDNFLRQANAADRQLALDDLKRIGIASDALSKGMPAEGFQDIKTIYGIVPLPPQLITSVLAGCTPQPRPPAATHPKPRRRASCG